MVAWTLSDLKTKSLVYFRDRTDLADYIGDGVDLATAYFSQKLRVREMMASTTLVPDVDGICTLPDDFIELITVTEDISYGVPLDSEEPVGIGSTYYAGVAGIGYNYRVFGSQLQLYPGSSNDVNILYYQKIPDLVDDTAETNWLLTKFPQAYLDYCRMWAADISEDPNEAKYSGKVDEWLDVISMRDQTSRYNRTSLDLSNEMIVP